MRSLLKAGGRQFNVVLNGKEALLVEVNDARFRGRNASAKPTKAEQGRVLRKALAALQRQHEAVKVVRWNGEKFPANGDSGDSAAKAAPHPTVAQGQRVRALVVNGARAERTMIAPLGTVASVSPRAVLPFAAPSIGGMPA